MPHKKYLAWSVLVVRGMEPWLPHLRDRNPSLVGPSSTHSSMVLTRHDESNLATMNCGDHWRQRHRDICTSRDDHGDSNTISEADMGKSRAPNL